MSFHLSRRTFCLPAIALTFFAVAGATGEPQPKQPAVDRIGAIEQGLGGRIGVAAIDTGDSQRIEYRGTERFPMCSTFKFLLAAAVLQKVDGNEEQLDGEIFYRPSDLLEWAPVTKEHVKDGSMTLEALCAAVIQYSDNTAANLLLQRIGGPVKLTRCLRSLGDDVTRLDRIEPSLNSAIEGDDRDTTSPDSMVSDLNVLLLDDRVSQDSRRRLEAWLAGNTLGTKRLRAGLPSAWRIGDKTGTGENGARGDIAIVRPPNRAPILVAVYLVGSARPSADLDAAFAEIGRIIAVVF